MQKRNLGWLERKLKVLGSFDGSLLKYVSSLGGMKETASKTEIDSSDVLKLDANENLFMSIHNLNVMLQDVVTDIDLRVYDPKGVVELKQALGRYVGVPPDCVVIGSGSEQLIDLVVDLFLEKGDNVISIVPSFFMYQKRVLLKEAKFYGVPLKKNLSLDGKAILDKQTPKTKLLFICSPNNPTGNQFAWNEIETLADESSSIIVLDEAYAEFADYSAASLACKKKNVIVLRTFSKAFGLAGLRFGYAVAHPDLALPLSSIIPYTVNTVTSKFVLRLLSSVEMVTESVRMVKMERKRLIDNFSAIKGIEVLDSEANFVTFKPYKEADFIHKKLLERKILIKNLGMLPVIGHCLRATVGLPDMNDRFIKALTEIMRMNN